MKFALVSLITVVTFPVMTNAQEKSTEWNTNGVFETRDDYYQFMGTVKQASINDPELRAMIPLINDVVLGQRIGQTSQKFAGEQTTIDLLANPDVRKELEMVDSQYEEIREVNARIQKSLAGQIRNIDFSKGSNVSHQLKALQSSANKELEAALLPHQLDRLNQIAAQSQLRTQSLARLLTSEPIKSQLDISDEQKSDLIQAEKEIERELQEKIDELQKKAREKLLGKLKRKQQEKVKNLFGDTFEFGKGNPKKMVK